MVVFKSYMVKHIGLKINARNRFAKMGELLFWEIGDMDVVWT